MATDFQSTIPTQWPLSADGSQNVVPWSTHEHLDQAAERCRAELSGITHRQHVDQRNLLARAFGLANARRFDAAATAPGALL